MDTTAPQKRSVISYAPLRFQIACRPLLRLSAHLSIARVSIIALWQPNLFFDWLG